MPLSDTPPMVLTPARVSQPQSEAPASVTVIDRNLIEASGARELYEVLKLVPGMSAVKVDGNVPTVSYHATQARDVRRMLVLLDGRSQYQPGLARVNWNDMPVDIQDVERIEVTRGPAAAAYGANAFAAVINIITRDPRDVSRNSVYLAGGNNAIRDGRAAAAGQTEDMAWRASVARRSDDGYDEPFEGSKLPDAKRIETLNSEWLWTASEKNSFGVQLGGSMSRLERVQDSGIQDLGEYQRDPVQNGERAFLQMEWQHVFSQTHQLKLTAYGQYNNEVTDFRVCYLDPASGQTGPGGGLFFSSELRDLYLENNGDLNATLGAAFADPDVVARYNALLAAGSDFCTTNEFDVQEERYDLELQDTLQINDRLRLVSGLNVRQDRAESQTYLSGTQDNLSYRAFGNLSAEVVRNVLLNLGGYWEHDEISETNFSPRAGLNWRFLPGHSVRYVYSEAIRTPDIYEERALTNIEAMDLSQPFASNTQGLLGWSPAYFFATQSSPGSQVPEEIRSWELGYFGQFRMLDLDVRYFQETLSNLLSGPINFVEFDPANDGKVTHQGSEAQLTWRPSVNHLFRATGAHIHTDTNIKTETRMAARDSASALWSWQMAERWGFSTAYYLFNDYNENTFERVDAQIRFRHQLAGSEVEWKAVVQHALNKAPLVFEENLYAEDRMWLGMSVRF